MTEWRKVLGWPYEVSNDGRVRRIGGRELRPQNQTNGYQYVCLCRWGTRQNHRVHRLVVAAFLDRYGGGEVNHIDGDKTNNRLENLEWVSHAHNQRHASEQNLMARGEAHGISKLKEQDVRDIRLKRSRGWLFREIAQAYNVSGSTIRRVVSGETWGHV